MSRDYGGGKPVWVAPAIIGGVGLVLFLFVTILVLAFGRGPATPPAGKTSGDAWASAGDRSRIGNFEIRFVGAVPSMLVRGTQYGRVSNFQAATYQVRVRNASATAVAKYDASGPDVEFADEFGNRFKEESIPRGWGFDVRPRINAALDTGHDEADIVVNREQLHPGKEFTTFMFSEPLPPSSGQVFVRVPARRFGGSDDGWVYFRFGMPHMAGAGGPE